MKIRRELSYVIVIIISLILISSVFMLTAMSLDNTKSINNYDSPTEAPIPIIETNIEEQAQEVSLTDLSPTHVPRDSVYEKSVYQKTSITPVKLFSQNSDSISLTYSKSEISEGGNHADVYTADNGDEYKFNQAGEILSITASDQTFLSGIGNYVGDKPTTTALTEDIAIKIATRAAKSYFGSKFEHLEYDRIRKDETSQCFYVYFYQKLGEDGFVNGIHARVTVFPNGTVCDCSIENYEDLIHFDQSLLNTLSKETLLSNIDKQIELLYGDDVSDYTVLSINLKNDNGVYYVEVKTKASFDSGFSLCDIFRYDLNTRDNSLSTK